jgi:hypothetical protein
VGLIQVQLVLRPSGSQDQVVIFMYLCTTSYFPKTQKFYHIQSRNVLGSVTQTQHIQLTIAVRGHSKERYPVLEPFSPHIENALTRDLKHVGENFRRYYDEFETAMVPDLRPDPKFED